MATEINRLDAQVRGKAIDAYAEGVLADAKVFADKYGVTADSSSRFRTTAGGYYTLLGALETLAADIVTHNQDAIGDKAVAEFIARVDAKGVKP